MELLCQQVPWLQFLAQRYSRVRWVLCKYPCPSVEYFRITMSTPISLKHGALRTSWVPENRVYTQIPIIWFSVMVGVLGKVQIHDSRHRDLFVHSPGRLIALQIMKSIVAQLIVDYDIELECDRFPPIYIGAGCIPDTGAKIILRRRVLSKPLQWCNGYSVLLPMSAIQRSVWLRIYEDGWK